MYVYRNIHNKVYNDFDAFYHPRSLMSLKCPSILPSCDLMKYFINPISIHCIKKQ